MNERKVTLAVVGITVLASVTNLVIISAAFLRQPSIWQIGDLIFTIPVAVIALTVFYFSFLQEKTKENDPLD